MLIVDSIQELLDFSFQPHGNYEQILNLKIPSHNSNGLENLDDIQFQKVCNLIALCSNLQLLELVDTDVDRLGSMLRLQPLCNAIFKCVNLEFLCFSSLDIQNLNSQYLQTICNMIIQFPKLQSLGLDWTPLHKLDLTDIEKICKSITVPLNLQTLSLIGTGLHELKTSSFLALCNTIRKCRNLKTIEFSQPELNLLQPVHFEMLCEAISGSHSLIKCNLHVIQSYMCKKRIQTINKILQKKQILLELSGEKKHTSLLCISAKVVAENPNLSTKNLPGKIRETIEKYRTIDATLKIKQPHKDITENTLSQPSLTTQFTNSKYPQDQSCKKKDKVARELIFTNYSSDYLHLISSSNDVSKKKQKIYKENS